MVEQLLLDGDRVGVLEAGLRLVRLHLLVEHTACYSEQEAFEATYPTLAQTAAGETAVKVYGNYCGPRWCNNEAIGESTCDRSMDAIDSVDECCKAHDACCAGTSTNCHDEMVACLEAAPACRMSSGMGFCPAMTEEGEPDTSSDAEPLHVPSHLYEAMKTNAATGGLFCEA